MTTKIHYATKEEEEIFLDFLMNLPENQELIKLWKEKKLNQREIKKK